MTHMVLLAEVGRPPLAILAGGVANVSQGLAEALLKLYAVGSTDARAVAVFQNEFEFAV